MKRKEKILILLFYLQPIHILNKNIMVKLFFLYYIYLIYQLLAEVCMRKFLIIVFIIYSMLNFGCSKNNTVLIQDAEKAFNNKDYNSAVNYYKKACLNDSYYACLKTASIYSSADYGMTDNLKADEFLKKSFISADKLCNNNDAKACRFLMQSYESGRGVEIDYNKANQTGEKACQLKDAYSCYYMAKIYADKVDLYTSFAEKSCSLDFPQGCLMLANSYLTGFNENFTKINIDINKGIENLEKACSISKEMCLNLGDLYLSGQDVPQNYELAEKYYTIAVNYYEPLCSKENNKMACRQINIIKNKLSD